MKRILLGLAAWTATAWTQPPVINPGGVVNTASYNTGVAALSRAGYPQTGGGPALAAGSIVSIFGSNLAASPFIAPTPLPLQLGGTSVTVNGTAAALFFVSPGQINFQAPSPGGAGGIVVTTAAGQSKPYPITLESDPAPGIFTVDSSGCGAAAAMNVSASGRVSLNSPANGAAPGDFLSIFGTGNGLVSHAPADGSPAPDNPLAAASSPGLPVFDFSAGGNEGPVFWAGRAPGLVGVDQFNFLVPPTVRRGCAVPLQIVNGNITAPVTVSIADGGGPCTDPPSQGYGEVMWEKATITSAAASVSVIESVALSLQASPGRQAPDLPVYHENEVRPRAYRYFGSRCGVAGYRSLAAGAVTAQVPGGNPTALTTAPLDPATTLNLLPQGGFTPVSQTQSGQAGGATLYRAVLPSGTIQSGAFSVAAGGSADVGAFQASAQIGSPIRITTPLAGVTLHSSGPPFPIQWTGGDPGTWVTVKLVGHYGGFDHYPAEWTARASDGQLTLQGTGAAGFGISGPVDLIVEVVPDPSQIGTFAAANLSLGGRALWKYSYRFEGVLIAP